MTVSRPTALGQVIKPSTVRKSLLLKSNPSFLFLSIRQASLFSIEKTAFTLDHL